MGGGTQVPGVASWRRSCALLPLSQPYFSRVCKEPGMSKHSANVHPFCLGGRHYPKSGGMRPGWWLCGARLCHLIGGGRRGCQTNTYFPATSCHPHCSQEQLPAELEAETCLSPWSNGAGTLAPEGSGVFNPHSASLCCVASYIRCPSLSLFLHK